MKLPELVTFLNDRLGVRDFPDDASLNGLQFEGKGEVLRVALAVDACEATFREAVRARTDMVIVHHGLYWGKVVPVTGLMRKRLGVLFEHDISLYACHLPLDAHPELGNNAEILRILGVKCKGAFGEYHGRSIGWWGETARAVPFDTFTARLEKKLATSCTVLAFGGAVKKVGVVSGGGGSSLYEAQERGLDTVITGEPSHSLHAFAEEVGLNVIFAGHYATETFGVKAIGEELRKKFGIAPFFVDHPTGL